MSESGESSSAPLTPLHIFPNVVRPYRFNWDPASRRPGGPESVSGTTEGNGDYFASQGADFQFNNASSLGLGLGTLPSEWSSSTQGFYGTPTICIVTCYARLNAGEQLYPLCSITHIEAKHRRKHTQDYQLLLQQIFLASNGRILTPTCVLSNLNGRGSTVAPRLLKQDPQRLELVP